MATEEPGTGIQARAIVFVLAAAVTAIGATLGHESTPDPLGVPYLGEAVFVVGLLSVIVALGWLAEGLLLYTRGS